jgi:hypothetical protein
MKILLINNNPVVSRLTALSARKESIKLDEIRDVSKLKRVDEYQIVFVDLESYTQEVSNSLKNSNIKKKVLFYTQEDKKKPEIFNLSILKPFLPSEVSAILRERKIEIERNENKSKEELSNLNELIAEKKSDLKHIEVQNKIGTKSKKTKEEKKSSILEPQKTEEEKLLAELNKSQKKIDEIKKSPDLVMKKPISQPSKEKEDEIKLFEIDDVDEQKSLKDRDKLFELDIPYETKKGIDKDEVFEIDTEKKIATPSNDEVLGFDMDSKEEFNLETTPKKSNIKNSTSTESTKVLDKDEISNIKNLLDDDIKTDDNISLEDVMTSSPPITGKEIVKLQSETVNKEPKKKKKKKYKRRAGSQVVLESLSSLPVDDLRRLLLGAEVHITIKFPKE